MKTLAIVSNYAHSLVTFRTHLIKDLSEEECRVYALAPDYTEQYREKIKQVGGTPIDYYMDRTGKNPIKDLISLYSLFKAIRKLNPDITFSYGIKPVVYGLWVSRVLGVEHRYAMVAGLGTLYVESKNESFKDSISRGLADFLYRFSLPLADKVFFQNPDDISLFEKKGFLKEGDPVLVNGSGVDLDFYKSESISTKPITFTLVARLIKEKGIYEFVKSARILKNKFTSYDIRFILIGDVDSNPSSVNRSEIETWVDEGIVKWPGFVENVEDWLEKTSVFVLPTYYREGTPRSILEAMSMSRPIITTDMPGSRETVVDGENGFLIEPKNVEALVGAMVEFINDPSLVKRFGVKSREKAESEYDVKDVNKAIINEMPI